MEPFAFYARVSRSDKTQQEHEEVRIEVVRARPPIEIDMYSNTTRASALAALPPGRRVALA
jgi:hypothetical protein